MQPEVFGMSLEQLLLIPMAIVFLADVLLPPRVRPPRMNLSQWMLLAMLLAYSCWTFSDGLITISIIAAVMAMVYGVKGIRFDFYRASGLAR